jgi:hypothetical protein
LWQLRLSGSGRCNVRNGIFIPLLDEHREALVDLADREWRRPVDQAAKILIEGLQREYPALESKTAAGVEPASAVPA